MSFPDIISKNSATEINPLFTIGVKCLIFSSRSLSAFFFRYNFGFVISSRKIWYKSVVLVASCICKFLTNWNICVIRGNDRCITEFIPSCCDVVRIFNSATEIVFRLSCERNSLSRSFFRTDKILCVPKYGRTKIRMNKNTE